MLSWLMSCVVTCKAEQRLLMATLDLQFNAHNKQQCIAEKCIFANHDLPHTHILDHLVLPMAQHHSCPPSVPCGPLT